MADRDLMPPEDGEQLPPRRNLAMRRGQRKRAICRERRIVLHVCPEGFVAGMTTRFCGRLAKGKLHCSCPICRRKSRMRPAMRMRRQDDAFRDQLGETDL